jgi:hypothetical protein
MEIIDVEKTRARLAELKPLCDPIKAGFEKMEAHYDRAKSVLTTQLVRLDKEAAAIEENFVTGVLAGKEPVYKHLFEMPAERARLEKCLEYLKARCRPVLDDLRHCPAISADIGRVEKILPELLEVQGRVKTLEDTIKTLGETGPDGLLHQKLGQEEFTLLEKARLIKGWMSEAESAIDQAKEAGLLK